LPLDERFDLSSQFVEDVMAEVRGRGSRNRFLAHGIAPSAQSSDRGPELARVVPELFVASSGTVGPVAKFRWCAVDVQRRILR